MFISPFDLNFVFMTSAELYRNNNPDAWYDDAIKQYEGSSYYDALKANPYLIRNNSEFSPNFLQIIGEALGDYSGRDNYYGNLRNQANQWLSEYIEKMRQDEYNSPLNQVERERVAGLNPDINGGSNISPGSAAENDQAFQPYVGNPDANSDSISRFASLVMQAYSFASGFAKDMFSFQSMANHIEGQDLDNAGKIPSIVEDFLKSSIGRPTWNKDSKSWDFPDLSLAKLDSYASKYFSSRSARNRFKKSVESSYGSLKSRFIAAGAIKDYETAVSAMSDALGKNLSYGWSGDDSYVFDPIIETSRILNSAELKIQKIEQSERYNTAKFHSEYSSGLDSSLASSAYNKANEASISGSDALNKQKEIDGIINGAIGDIMKYLEDAAIEGGVPGALAKGMLLFYSAFRANAFPSLPSINIDRSSKTFVKSLNP